MALYLLQDFMGANISLRYILTWLVLKFLRMIIIWHHCEKRIFVVLRVSNRVIFEMNSVRMVAKLVRFLGKVIIAYCLRQ